MRRMCFVVGVLAAAVTGMPAYALLVNNGGFDINAADWNAAGGGGPWVPGHTATGGNPGGYVTLQSSDNTWSVWYQVGTESLAEWGIPVGTTISPTVDIIDLGSAGNNTAVGLKIESWNSGLLGEAASEFAVTGSWQTYSFNYTIPSNAESLKFVVTNVNYNGRGVALYGYDNVRIGFPDGRTPALKPVPAVGDPLLPADPVLSWTNPDPNRPGDTLTADVFILESDQTLLYDPNLGPDVIEAGVVQVADGITAESVNLIEAGYPVQPEKYYYWAVHINDPTAGVIEGFTWYFNTFDAAPRHADAGSDQYLWLGMDTNEPGQVTLTLSGSVVDDGKSPLTMTWSLDTALTETDPATVVTIHNPVAIIDQPEDGLNTHTTTVTLDNTGWFYFVLTAEDAVGSTSDVVNVGVYADACQAAFADPADVPFSGDLDGNCTVDLNDLAILAADWLGCMSEKLGCMP